MTRYLDFYRTLMKISVQEQFQYRAANYFYMIGMIAEPVIYLVVWSTVADPKSGGGGQIYGNLFKHSSVTVTNGSSPLAGASVVVIDGQGVRYPATTNGSDDSDPPMPHAAPSTAKHSAAPATRADRGPASGTGLDGSSLR